MARFFSLLFCCKILNVYLANFLSIFNCLYIWFSIMRCIVTNQFDIFVEFFWLFVKHFIYRFFGISEHNYRGFNSKGKMLFIISKKYWNFLKFWLIQLWYYIWSNLTKTKGMLQLCNNEDRFVFQRFSDVCFLKNLH